jgi:hypothetical protein
MIDKGDSKNSKNIPHTCFLGEPLRFGLRPRSRRAIRSITFALRARWFRFYPSRYLTQNKPTDVVFAYF